MAEYRKTDDIQTVRLKPREAQAQRARSVAIAIGLAALVVIFYASTVVKFGPALMDRPQITLAKDRSVPDPDFVAPLPAKE